MANEIRKDLFETLPVPKAIAKLAIPTILAQLVSLVYNLADTLFIGLLNDEYMVAAVSLSQPLFMILVSLANLFGVGGSSVISRALGVYDTKRAKNASSVCIYACIISTFILAIVCVFVLEPIASLLGASENTLGYTVDYMFWIFVIGGIPTVSATVLSHIIRSEGNAVIASIGTSIGGIINIALDPLFIFVFNMDVKGVAIATMISNCIAVIFFMSYLFVKRNKTIVSASPKNFIKNIKLIGPVLSIGAPAALNSILVSVAIAFLNKLTSAYGDTPLAAMGIVKKIDMIPWSFMFGMTHGILPLIGYNYAAKNYKRMKSVIKYALIITVIVNAVFITLFESLAPYWVQIFIRDEDVVEYGATFLRIICTCVPFMSIGFLFNMTFQAMGKPYHSFVLSICRQGVLFIPILFLMNYLVGLNGLAWTQTIADGGFALLGGIMYYVYIRKAEKSNTSLPEIEPESKN